MSIKAIIPTTTTCIRLTEPQKQLILLARRAIMYYKSGKIWFKNSDRRFSASTAERLIELGLVKQENYYTHNGPRKYQLTNLGEEIDIDDTSGG